MSPSLPAAAGRDSAEPFMANGTVAAPRKGDSPDPGLADGSGAMFDVIADRYDRLNRILSLGIDRRWRRKTVAALDLPSDARVLDVATGTADLALEMARQFPSSFIVGIDPSERMLAIGRDKAAAAGAESSLRLEVGDAQDLPFETDSFDGVAIAFGIRNVADRLRGLREMVRVTRPGGRVAILEISEPRGLNPVALGARFYCRTLLPWIGGLLSGSRQYRYLQRSMAAFPPPEEFGALMAKAGLKELRLVPMTFGVSHLYVGRVPEASVAEPVPSQPMVSSLPTAEALA